MRDYPVHENLFRLALLPIALAGCLAEPDETTTTNELFTPTGTTLYTPGQSIRVCWVTVTLPGETLPASGCKPPRTRFARS